MSMCCSFDISTEHYQMVTSNHVTPEQMFSSMKNTFEVRREGWEIREFYKTIVETFLLKYISIEERLKFERY